MRVFVTRKLPPRAMARLASLSESAARPLPELAVDVWPEPTPPTPQTLSERARGCAGLLCLLTDRIDEGLLEATGTELRVVSQMAVGVDNIDLAACRAREVAVGHTPGVLTEATADLTLALMLAACRRLLEAADDVRAGRWQTWEPLGWAGVDLHGATVGIVGLGRIGAAVARRLSGFDATVLYSAPRPSRFAEAVGARQAPLDALLEQSDIVTLHAPLTADTHHLLDAAALARLRPGAVLINTARGALVDQQALLDALSAGRLGAVGLDVTTPEPLPPDHALLSRRDVIVLPHIGSASVATRERMADIAIDNLVAGLRGEPLPAAVPA